MKVLFFLIAGVWLSVAQASVSSQFPELETRLDLSKPQVLKTLVAPEYQEGAPLKSALETIGKDYDRSSRTISLKKGETSKYGFAFPPDSEVLAYMMRVCPGKTVLEIAGASGENAIMMAFAGAAKVYMNDIEEGEINLFEAKKNKLPDPLKARLHSLPGNIFEILEKHPALERTIDIVYCRNFYHFLKDEQRPSFHSLLKKLTKENAQIIVSANSVYTTDGLYELSQKHVTVTHFRAAPLLLHNLYDDRPQSIRCFQLPPAILEEDRDPLSFNRREILTFYGKTMKTDNENLRSLDPMTQKDALNTIFSPEFIAEKNKLTAGYVVVVEVLPKI